MQGFGFVPSPDLSSLGRSSWCKKGRRTRSCCSWGNTRHGIQYHRRKMQGFTPLMFQRHNSSSCL